MGIVRTLEESEVVSPATVEREWPQHFPACCPPTDASATQGEVYRFVANDPVDPKDMVSYLEEGKAKGRDCQRAGLSTLVDLDHAREVQILLPTQRGKRIARAMLSVEHGKIKQTGQPGHYTLWVRAKYHAQAHTLFKIVA